MFGNIVYLSDNIAHIAVPEGVPVAQNLMNMHVIFEDNNKKILGEVADFDQKIVKVRFLGEISDGRFIAGVIRKPSLQAKLRVINEEELKIIMGDDRPGTMKLGVSPLYNDYPVRIDINDLFSNHFAVFGNTGSGKSCGVSRLLQNVFYDPGYMPFKSNFLIFDAYGEYHNAFKEINKINPNYCFKYYTTNKNAPKENLLSIPIWLLNRDDYALLLEAETHSQLTIIETMLKYVNIFVSEDDISKRYCNHIIAKAMMAILFTNQTSASKKNDVFQVLATCTTNEFNLDAEVQGVGYTRKFKDLFIIDTAGQFPESNLMIEYISSFIDEKLDTYEAKTIKYYTLEDLERALAFTLISEGLLKNEKMYNEAVTLKVRLHALTIGDNSPFLRYPQFITLENFVASIISSGGRKAQIINFNLEEVDDTFAKCVTKIYSRMLFEFTKRLSVRASIPFHIFLEESHRYVQEDRDKFLLGYNIFERIAKEGRKYGIIFNLISQRPVELSDTVISQISNFLIFKMNHPRDLEYIEKMLPNISKEVIDKQKTLQPGTCVAFGKAFKVPMIVKMEMPNPEPYSSNCDVYNMWQVKR